MKHLFLSSLISTFLLPQVIAVEGFTAAAQQLSTQELDDFQRLYQDYAEAITKEIIIQESPLISFNSQPSEASIQKILKLLSMDGSFSDLDYKDQSMSKPQLRQHVQRLESLCHYLYLLERQQLKAAARGISAKDLEASIQLALNYWLQKNPKSRNWWINDIGVPRSLGQACILFREHMSAEQWALAQKRMSIKRSIPGGKPTGTNLAWYSETDLLCGLICNNYQLILDSLKIICRQAEEIGNHEGIQVDGSYHQHGAQQQMANYGQGFAQTFAFYSHLFAGTKLALPASMQKNVNFLFFEGYRWLLWHSSLDINTMNRQIGPHCMLGKGKGTKTCAYLLKANSSKEDQAKFDEILQDKPLHGQKHFQESELTIHRTKDWMLSLRMHSQRLRGLESCNEDGRNVSFMADGGMYLYQTKDMAEYEDIFPLWQPRRIPGVTSKESEQYLDMYRGNNSSFVGGITDGTSGITAMELDRYHAKAFKSWVITDEWILALGSDLALNEEGILTTSIAQQISWEAPTLVMTDPSKKEQRYHHQNTGYIVWNAQDIRCENEEKTGDWAEVASSLGRKGKNLHHGTIMSLYLRHIDGEKQYRYLILPQRSSEETAQFSAKDIKILYQTEDIHAVQYKDCYYIAVRKMQDYPELPFDLKTLTQGQIGIYMITQEQGEWKAQRATYPEIIGQVHDR